MKYNLNNPVDIQKASIKFDKLCQDKKEIELKEIRPIRSLQQNKYLHVLFALFGIEFGYTIDEAKTLLKRECNFMSYEKNGKKFLRHTSQMQTDELTKFIDWIRTYSAQNGLYLLTSDEYITNRIMIDNQIEIHKEYL